jgi:hypothetical protein
VQTSRMLPKRGPRRGWWWLVTLLLWLAPQPASANMANPILPGDPIGEPSPALQTLTIENEMLTLDLRPLAADKAARVGATYMIRNDGATTRTDLLFVAAALSAGAAEVALDGTPVPFHRAPTRALPSSWQPPATTPGLGGRADLAYHTPNSRGLRFALTMPPGRHTIAVHYAARATAYSDGVPTRYWQLGYVLAPARQWAGFGGLDVSVHLPAGWSAASRPLLARQGDELTAHFTDIPADTLALTVQDPPPAPQRGPLFVTLGDAMLALMMGLPAGRALGRRQRGALWLLPFSVLLAAGGTWAYASVAMAEPAVDATQQAWTYRYDQGGSIGAATAIFLAELTIIQGSAWLTQRRTKALRQAIAPCRVGKGSTS